MNKSIVRSKIKKFMFKIWSELLASFPTNRIRGIVWPYSLREFQVVLTPKVKGLSQCCKTITWLSSIFWYLFKDSLVKLIRLIQRSRNSLLTLNNPKNSFEKKFKYLKNYGKQIFILCQMGIHVICRIYFHKWTLRLSATRKIRSCWQWWGHFNFVIIFFVRSSGHQRWKKRSSVATCPNLLYKTQ